MKSSLAEHNNKLGFDPAAETYRLFTLLL